MTIHAPIAATPVALDDSIDNYELGQVVQQDVGIPETLVAKAVAVAHSAPIILGEEVILPIYSGSEDIATPVVYVEASADAVIPIASSQRVLMVGDDMFVCDEENAVSNIDSEYTTVSVFKPRKRTAMGITFVDDNANPGVVRVDQMDADSPFRNTPLAEGDVVMAINQVQARSAKIANRVVQGSEQWLTVTTHRSNNSKPDRVTTFLRKRVAHQRLGIRFLVDPNDGALLVWKVEGNGLLAHISLLKVADVVLRVNNTTVSTPEEATIALDADPYHVRLDTKTEGGVVLVLSPRAPLPRYFWYNCVGLLIVLVVVMGVIFYFARDNDCEPFCELSERRKQEKAANDALNNDDQ